MHVLGVAPSVVVLIPPGAAGRVDDRCVQLKATVRALVAPGLVPFAGLCLLQDRERGLRIFGRSLRLAVRRAVRR